MKENRTDNKQEFTIGEKVVINSIGEITAMRKSAVSGEITYTVLFDDKQTGENGDAMVNAKCLTSITPMEEYVRD